MYHQIEAKEKVSSKRIDESRKRFYCKTYLWSMKIRSIQQRRYIILTNEQRPVSLILGIEKSEKK